MTGTLKKESSPVLGDGTLSSFGIEEEKKKKKSSLQDQRAEARLQRQGAVCSANSRQPGTPGKVARSPSVAQGCQPVPERGSHFAACRQISKERSEDCVPHTGLENSAGGDSPCPKL